MSWVKFSIAVVLTSAALVIALFATGIVVVGHALASSLPVAAQQVRDHTLDGQNLPSEITGLKDVPASERFAHFKGLQVALTDTDGKPVQISVTPGVATSVAANSLTIAGNDGASHTYAITDQTFERSGSIASGQNIVVVTMNDASTARAVFNVDAHRWHN